MGIDDFLIQLVKYCSWDNRHIKKYTFDLLIRTLCASTASKILFKPPEYEISKQSNPAGSLSNSTS